MLAELLKQSSVTEEEIKQWNTQLRLDDAFWAASSALSGIRQMHCIQNTHDEVTIARHSKYFGVEGEEKGEGGGRKLCGCQFQHRQFLAPV